MPVIEGVVAPSGETYACPVIMRPTPPCASIWCIETYSGPTLPCASAHRSAVAERARRLLKDKPKNEQGEKRPRGSMPTGLKSRILCMHPRTPRYSLWALQVRECALGTV